MTQNITDTLNQIRSLIYTGNVENVVNSVKNKDIAVFLGNTRGGKSTVVNFILGTPLLGNKVRNNIFNIIKENPASPGPKIGTGSASETSIPSVYNSLKLVNTTIVDAPGFDDNRGPAQDISNSFYIKEIFSNANSVKVVVICDINDIVNDNINPFINLMDSLHKIIPHENKLTSAVTLIFTKDRENLSKEDITNILNEKIVRQPAIQISNRPLIEYLVRNINEICIVKMPTKDGKINEVEVFGNLVEAIQGNNGKLLRDVLANTSPGISDKSRNFLLEARKYFTEMNEFDQVMNSVKIHFNASLAEFENVNAYTVSTQVPPVRNRLIAIENNVKSIQNPSWGSKELLQRMKIVVPAESQLSEGSNIYTKLEFIKFVDGLLNLTESNIFKVKINQTLNDMLNKISDCRHKLNDKQMALQDQENKIRQEQLIKKQKEEAAAFQEAIRRLQQARLNIPPPPQPSKVEKVVNNVIVRPVEQVGHVIAKPIDAVTKPIRKVVKKCSIM